MPPFLRQLYADHDRIRRLLTDLSRQLQAMTQGGDALDATLDLGMAGWMDYLDEVHHSREEHLFSRLRMRSPESAAEVESLGWQHSELERHLEDLSRVFGNAAECTGARRAELLESCQLMVNDYLHHLKWEEENFFPLARQQLREHDWAEVAKEWEEDNTRPYRDLARDAAMHAVSERLASGTPSA